MWIKFGTRGDYRVIYVILAFLVFLGLRSAYYSLYDLNGGPEKRSKIVRELDMVIRPDNVSPDSIIWLQKTNVTEYIGGARDFEETMFTDLAQGEIYELYKDNAKKKGWKESVNGEYFIKDTMKMNFKFVDASEYESRDLGIPEHLRGKTIFKIRIEIK